jgi:hypothetical protein
LIGFWFLTQLFDAGTVADVQIGGWHILRTSAAISSGLSAPAGSKTRAEAHGEGAWNHDLE